MRTTPRFCLVVALICIGMIWGNTGTVMGQDHPNYTRYVNPFLGTDFFGHTFPGASLPFAMVHVSPDCHTVGWTYGAGYTYSDESIMGFSHTHFSGTGMVSGGDILLQPMVSNRLKVVPGTRDNPEEGYRSRFDHKDEQASPGYYAVYLKDNQVKVELTATNGPPCTGIPFLQRSMPG